MRFPHQVVIYLYLTIAGLSSQMPVVTIPTKTIIFLAEFLYQLLTLKHLFGIKSRWERLERICILRFWFVLKIP